MSAEPAAAAPAKSQVQTLPEFVTKRLEAFRALEDRTPKVEPSPITIILLPENSKFTPDVTGKEIQGIAGQTTPHQILNEHMPKLPAFVAAVDDTMWDLDRALVGNCKLTLITFADERGKDVFWHSSAHVLGSSIENELGVEIATGPVDAPGFFYEFAPTETKIDAACLARIEKRCNSMSNKKSDYERKMATREEALALFESNHYKQYILTHKVPPGSLVSVYRTGTFVDLCRGPHVADASIFKAWWIKDISASIFYGQTDKPVNRIRAVTYPTKPELKDYKAFLEEAAKRDHRQLGVKHDLFFFHPWSPGCGFFYPDGCHVYNKLMEMIRKEYHARGYNEVLTPNIYYDDLFKTSGHWAHYRDDMFHFTLEEDKVEKPPCCLEEDAEPVCCADCCHREMGLKPMNCPGHCLVFRSKDRSYRELPIRMAEFGVLHRNEASGALSGLTRVRRFVQDDAHIFLRRDQIGQEVAGVLDFMQKVYFQIFKMEMEFTLSTINMNKYMGELAVWEEATDLLRKALVERGVTFREAPEEAAFYGPKIDCLIKDCLGRKFQLATVQLDFQLPERFELVYFDKDRQPQRPVMVHRAVLGSIERFMAIAVEHFKARFPFWLSPHQICLIPQNMSKPEHLNYCHQLWDELHAKGFAVDIDETDVSMAKKIARARDISLFHAILVIGDKEVAEKTLAVRWWNQPPKAETPVMKLEEFMEKIQKMVDEYD